MEYCITGTKGLIVTFEGERYILADDIAYERKETDYWFKDITNMIDPTAYFSVAPAVQVQSVSRPDAILEMMWHPMTPEELDAWIEKGDFNQGIHGIIETEDD